MSNELNDWLQENKNEQVRLKAELTKANDQYRLGLPSGMSDQEYDNKLDELRDIMTTDEEILEFNEFRESLFEVGGDVTHDYIIGSLRKTKAEDDSFPKWYKKSNRTDLLLSEKLDGISVVLKFIDGKLVLASTRGDGKTGKNQTAKVKHIVPTLDEPFTGQLRGEIVLTQTNLDLLNANGGDYKNTRNTVAGVIGRNTIDVDVIKHLDVYVYQIMGSDKHKVIQYRELNQLGLKTPINVISTTEPSIDDLVGIYNDWSTRSDYDIDGIVISDLNHTDENKKLPDNQIAFKINQDIYDTSIIDIQWQLSKDGLLKPVAILSPTEIGGAMISRATLHNYENVVDNNVRYNSGIKLIRSGDVIPYIQTVYVKPDSGRLVNIPDFCPSCGTELIPDGVDLKCTNATGCTRQQVLQVESFIKRIGCMNASEKSLVKFGINTFNDLITWRPNQKYKSETKFYKELETKVFHSTPEELFSCLGFCGVGKKTVSLLLELYSIDSLVGGMVDILPSGIGDSTIEKVETYGVGNKHIVDMIVNDTRFKLKEADEPAAAGGCLDGLAFCCTGSLESITRGDLFKLIESKGGTIKSSVTKVVNYLVTNTPNSGTSKNAKSKKLGIPIITESEFFKLVSDVDNSTGDIFDI